MSYGISVLTCFAVYYHIDSTSQATTVIILLSMLSWWQPIWQSHVVCIAVCPMGDTWPMHRMDTAKVHVSNLVPYGHDLAMDSYHCECSVSAFCQGLKHDSLWLSWSSWSDWSASSIVHQDSILIPHPRMLHNTSIIQVLLRMHAAAGYNFIVQMLEKQLKCLKLSCLKPPKLYDMKFIRC